MPPFFMRGKSVWWSVFRLADIEPGERTAGHVVVRVNKDCGIVDAHHFGVVHGPLLSPGRLRSGSSGDQNSQYEDTHSEASIADRYQSTEPITRHITFRFDIAIRPVT
jgi:hypothetical protein